MLKSLKRKVVCKRQVGCMKIDKNSTLSAAYVTRMRFLFVLDS